jgi:3',5'-cyclic AMP phosphodiesterase CpdA
MEAEVETLAFPFVRRIGPIALIGLNSAVETPPFVASGRLGSHQIEVTQTLLHQLASEDVIRVVLIHHPPLTHLAPPRRRLLDAPHFVRVVEREGAELVLYGHNHQPAVDWIKSSDKLVPIVGAASASAAQTHGADPLASYNVFTFFKSSSGLRIRHIIRGIESSDGPVTKMSSVILEPPN